MDLSGDANLYPSILRPQASVVIYGTSMNMGTLPVLWLMQNSITLRFFIIYDISEADRSAAIAELSDLIQRGRLIHTVAQRVPLDDIAEAHEIVERGEVIGNVVVDIG
jgi:NADPH:quinone reductase